MREKINKKGQEEMVGFALIIIIVSVILLVFLGFYLSKPSTQTIQSYETESFVQSMLQYSTKCQNYFGYISVENLIFMCNSGTQCSDGEDSCMVLNTTLQGILSNSWPVGQGSSIKGYNLNITSSTGWDLSISAGNITSSSEGTSQDFPNSNGVSVNVVFNGYY
jgi:Ni,Fe-hydrogenase I cytochrome b subunit